MKMIDAWPHIRKHQRHEQENNHDRHVGRNRHGPLASAAVVGLVQATFVFMVMDDAEIERDAQVQEGNDPRYATPLHVAVRKSASATTESQVPVLASGLILMRSCR
jgi:cytochrome b